MFAFAHKEINAPTSQSKVINGPTEQSWIGRGMGLRVGFININDMYNNDVCQGVVYAYEAYEAK